MSDPENYYDSDSHCEMHEEEEDDIDEEAVEYAEDDDEEEKGNCDREVDKVGPQCLDEQDLVRSMNQVIHSVSSLLSLPPDACSILLRNFRWDVLTLHDSWFSDESRARKSAGLLIDPTSPLPLPRRCPICFTRCKPSDLTSAACGHSFCKDCWHQYITIAINDGFGCLLLRCPNPNCSVSVDDVLINSSTCHEARAKYSRFLLSNFVEGSKEIKWCPAPGCEYAIRFTGVGDVSCRCSYTFCWECAGEPHRPVDCETALKWHEKNSADSCNAEWMLVNSKPCPKCHRSIEKNQGCNHMTCSAPCYHQFCWNCMGSWDNHRGYACNRYDKKRKNTEEDHKRSQAKSSLAKYTHYYNRWINNHRSRQKAIDSLESFRAESVQRLSDLYSETDASIEASFIEAWNQIVECRRVLKWTYAYGYFLPDNQKDKQTLFEDLQGQAEMALERLHHCAETELKPFLEAQEEWEDESRSKSFFIYKLKVMELTNTTKKFFKNMVQGLETGLVQGSGSDGAA